MARTIEEIWTRIGAHEGGEFALIRGQRFTYEVFAGYLRPVGRVRHLSKTNFANALARVPFENPASIKDLQGPSYVYAILMDDRIRRSDW